MSYKSRRAMLLEWDTNHFGFRIASFGPQECSDIKTAIHWALHEEIHLLMGRCDATTIPVIHELERSGFLLMDTFVRYTFDFSKKNIPEDICTIPVRPFKHEDIESIGKIARLSFNKYTSHFHNDPRLNSDDCCSLYEKWAVNSCKDENLANEVFVADDNGKILGFITLKKLDERTGDGILSGVDISAQRKGIYKSFIINGVNWCKEQGLEKMELEPLLINYGVQRVWQRLGFEIYKSGHTFHLWLNNL